MSINRQNYEEYFLMYIDDELSIHQRMEVEWFVQQHSDLANELDILQRARLIPDSEIQFKDKQSLLQFADKGINTGNYEEYMLLYIDNELDSADRASVEKFVLQNPHLQEHFSILQKTILAPEQVVFEHKEKLYRHSKDRRRIITVPFIRIAAAAAILVASLGIWMFTGKKQVTDSTPEIAVTSPVKTPAARPPATNEATTPAGTNGSLDNKNTDKPAIAEIQPAKNHSRDVGHSLSEEKAEKDQPAQIAKKEARSTDEVYAKQDNINDKPVISQNYSQLQAADPQLLADNDASSTKPITTPSADEPVVYKELNTDDIDNRTVYVGSMQINKTKIKGFFKKASRLFNRPQDEDSDGKLQIANFEIEKETK